LKGWAEEHLKSEKEGFLSVHYNSLKIFVNGPRERLSSQERVDVQRCFYAPGHRLATIKKLERPDAMSEKEAVSTI
jgi:hypothetical protein